MEQRNDVHWSSNPWSLSRALAWFPPLVRPLGARVRWLNFSPLVWLSRVQPTGQRVSSWVLEHQRFVSDNTFACLKGNKSSALWMKENRLCLYANSFFGQIRNTLCEVWTLKLSPSKPANVLKIDDHSSKINLLLFIWLHLTLI